MAAVCQMTQQVRNDGVASGAGGEHRSSNGRKGHGTRHEILDAEPSAYVNKANRKPKEQILGRTCPSHQLRGGQLIWVMSQWPAPTTTQIHAWRLGEMGQG